MNAAKAEPAISAAKSHTEGSSREIASIVTNPRIDVRAWIAGTTITIRNRGVSVGGGGGRIDHGRRRSGSRWGRAALRIYRGGRGRRRIAELQFPSRFGGAHADFFT